MNLTAILLAAVGEVAPAVAPATAPAAEGLSTGANLAAAAGLLVLGLGLVALEFVLISGGALGITALLCAVGAVYFAFAAGPLAGWVFTLLVPITGFLVIRAGLQWMRTSSMVVQSEITEHAGYAHSASEHGIAVGSTGELVTDAFPTGRARFTQGGTSVELDVVVRGTVLSKGAAIAIKAIEGPTIIVVAAPAAPTSSPSTAS